MHAVTSILGLVLLKKGIWAICFMIFQSPMLSASEDALRSRIDALEQRLDKMEARSEIKKEEPVSERGGRSTQGDELAELRRQLDIVAAELELLRSGEPVVEVTDDEARAKGLGPSAVSVYRRQRGVSFAGYGEMIYSNFSAQNEAGVPTGKTSKFDFLRAIIYAGYRFSDRFVFNSEIEFEHASTSIAGSASVEFAYLDFLVNDNLTFRGGLLLMPMGLVNELHEPTVFLGTLRPETERRIIPTTWRENGFGVLGSAGIFNYRIYVVNGLDGSNFTSNGLRGGRQKGSKAKSSHMAVVARLDVTPSPGIFFGGSIYSGGSGQGLIFEDSQVDVGTKIGELHGQIQVRGFDLRGLFARAALGDVISLNQVLGLKGMSSVGELQQGQYVQFGYNVLSQGPSKLGLMPYYRFEMLDTQEKVPAGFLRDPKRNRIFHTFGVEFKPIPNIVIKSDFQWNRNKARMGQDQFNIGLGYNF